MRRGHMALTLARGSVFFWRNSRWLAFFLSKPIMDLSSWKVPSFSVLKTLARRKIDQSWEVDDLDQATKQTHGRQIHFQRKTESQRTGRFRMKWRVQCFRLTKHCVKSTENRYAALMYVVSAQLGSSGRSGSVCGWFLNDESIWSVIALTNPFQLLILFLFCERIHFEQTKSRKHTALWIFSESQWNYPLDWAAPNLLETPVILRLSAIRFMRIVLDSKQNFVWIGAENYYISDSRGGNLLWVYYLLSPTASTGFSE